MEGIQIGKSGGELAGSLSALAAIGAVAAGIWIGPKGIYAVCGIGISFAVLSLLFAMRVQSYKKPFGFPLIMLAVHSMLLITGLILHAMFLSPLSAESAKMPRLQTLYEDPDGNFTLRGPAGWTYRPAPSRFESGVRLQPATPARYVGVAEAAVYVRRLESVPASADAFLENAASAFSKNKSGNKIFDIKTERGTSLSGIPVMWSMITVYRFWVPMYQISLFGVKDGRYLCSVSASGLSSHAGLARLICLGLFERVVVIDRKS